MGFILRWLRSFPHSPQRAHARDRYRSLWRELADCATELNQIEHPADRAAHLSYISDLANTIASVAGAAYGRRGGPRADQARDESRFARALAAVETARATHQPRRRDWHSLELLAGSLLDQLCHPTLDDRTRADIYAVLQTKVYDLRLASEPVRIFTQLQQWHAARAAAAATP